MEDQDIQKLVGRLARPHRSGGQVIERAALLAEGGDFASIMAWIESHAGEPEEAVAAPATGGLYGGRVDRGGRPTSGTPQRFVLPAGALD